MSDEDKKNGLACQGDLITICNPSVTGGKKAIGLADCGEVLGSSTLLQFFNHGDS